jgi:hypothetical protein
LRAAGGTTQSTVEGLEIALHGLCQPLTVLHCKLELGLLSGDPESMRQAIQEGIRECVRSNAAVARMRSLVLEAINHCNATEGTGCIG